MDGWVAFAMRCFSLIETKSQSSMTSCITTTPQEKKMQPMAYTVNGLAIWRLGGTTIIIVSRQSHQVLA